MPVSPALSLRTERLRGAAFMAASALAFSGMSLFVKLASAELPAMEIVAARSAFMTVATLALMRAAGVARRGVNRPLLVARGVAGAVALSLLYVALGRLPLGDAVTIQNTAPVWTALFAALALGERLRPAVLASIAVSLGGVALVARPAFLFGDAAGGLDLFAVGLVVVAAVLMGVAYTAVRKLRETDHPLAIIYALSWAGVALSVPFALGGGWLWPTAHGWALLAGVAVCTQAGQWTLTRGLHLLDAATATAIGYLQVALAFGWGILVFGDVPSWPQVAGAALVVASVLALAAPRAASRLKRSTASQPPAGVETLNFPNSSIQKRCHPERSEPLRAPKAGAAHAVEDREAKA